MSNELSLSLIVGINLKRLIRSSRYRTQENFAYEFGAEIRTVRNVVDFGAFIDIGLHNDGLVHISKITNKYIKHPSEVLSVGDIVTCYVIDINKEKEKVSLSLINPIEK